MVAFRDRLVLAGDGDDLVQYSAADDEMMMGAVCDVLYSSALLRVIVWHHDPDLITIWSSLTGLLQSRIPLSVSVISIDLDRRGATLFIVQTDGNVAAYSLHHNAHVYSIPSGPACPPTWIRASSCRDQVVLVEKSGRYRTSTSAGDAVLNQAVFVDGLEDAVTVFVSDCGSWVAAGRSDGRLVVQQIWPSTCVVLNQRAHDAAVMFVTMITTTTSLMVSIDQNNVVKTWVMPAQRRRTCRLRATSQVVGEHALTAIAADDAHGHVYLATVDGIVIGLDVAAASNINRIAEFRVANDAVRVLRYLAPIRCLAVGQYHSTSITLVSVTDGTTVGVLGDPMLAPFDDGLSGRQRLQRRRRSASATEWNLQIDAVAVENDLDRIADDVLHRCSVFMTELPPSGERTAPKPTTRSLFAKPPAVAAGPARRPSRVLEFELAQAQVLKDPGRYRRCSSGMLPFVMKSMSVVKAGQRLTNALQKIIIRSRSTNNLPTLI